jgi:hypothetical protein
MRTTILSLWLTLFPGLAIAAGSGGGFACDLRAMTKDERTQHAALARELFASVQEQKELKDGYAFRLTAERWRDAARWAELEQKCCPFFAFTLDAAPDRGPVWLRITGRPGAKAFMKEEFGL